MISEVLSNWQVNHGGFIPDYNYKNFYGYDVIDGELIINEEQAEVVRTIFEWYLDSLSMRQIKNRLESMKVKTATGNFWTNHLV